MLARKTWLPGAAVAKPTEPLQLTKRGQPIQLNGSYEKRSAFLSDRVGTDLYDHANLNSCDGRELPRPAPLEPKMSNPDDGERPLAQLPQLSRR